jgi:hypothetical protein
MSHHHGRSRADARGRRANAAQADDRVRPVTTADGYTISTTWIDPVEIADQELEVIELYLGREIDRLLGRAQRPKARGPPD